MTKELKSKANSRAKSPAAKRAPKSAPKTTKTAVKSKPETASKTAGMKSTPAVVKAKTKSAKAEAAKTVTEKSKTAKAEPVEKRTAKPEKPKATGAKVATEAARGKKAKSTDAASFRIGEPVLDPIGDVISGEARTYLGDKESQGRVKADGQAEIDAYREQTEIDATDGTLELERGSAAASGAGDEEEDSANEAGAKARPPAKLERLQKILSQAGIASRRHAEEMIVAGRVMVNGQIVTQMGSKADAGRDHIRVDGKLLKGAERHRYFVLNKPKGYVTTVSDPEGRPTVMEFFAKAGERLYPVGRLDYQSEGLLLMTNDGELANLVTKAGSGVEKTYLVKVAGQPSEEELDRLRGGVAIERGETGSERVRTAPAQIRQVRVGDNPWYEVVLTEGRNRELRKMFAEIGHFAEKIRRVGYGPLELDVEPGKLRELTVDEVNALRLTAEGKMRPKRMRVELPKEKSRGAGKFGDRATRGDRPARPWGAKPAGKGFDGPRGTAPGRDAKRFGQRVERGPRTERKPREGTFGGARESVAGRGAEPGRERPRFDKRQSKPFGARPGFDRPERRPSAGRPGGFEERPKFGERRPFSGGQRFGGGQPSTGAKPRFDKPGYKRPSFGGGRESSAGPSGERREWKPREGQVGGSESKPFERGQRTGHGGRPQRAGGNFGGRSNFGARPKFSGGREGGGREGGGQDRGAGRGGERREWKPREQTAGRFDSAPRKPFRPQGGRPAFTRPEGSPKIIIEPQDRFEGARPPFKGNDEGKKRFEDTRPPFNKAAKTGFGGERGKGFSKGPKFGRKPGTKSGGFGKSRGGAGGGKKFGGGKPGAGRGGFNRGS
ncbi:MAG TPA: pseudouridine synthase [Terracidiphilus sp.]|jgi:23S rRNA pseudouridine2605 synthase